MFVFHSATNKYNTVSFNVDECLGKRGWPLFEDIPSSPQPHGFNIWLRAWVLLTTEDLTHNVADVSQWAGQKANKRAQNIYNKIGLPVSGKHVGFCSLVVKICLPITKHVTLR